MLTDDMIEKAAREGAGKFQVVGAGAIRRAILARISQLEKGK